MQESGVLDARRALLTVLHFPDQMGIDTSRMLSHRGGALPAPGGSAGVAAYNPATVVPLLAALVSSGALGPAGVRFLAQQGLLSLCIRGLASVQPSMRAACLAVLRLLQVWTPSMPPKAAIFRTVPASQYQMSLGPSSGTLGIEVAALPSRLR
mmetsp:Transcript_24556/g.61835  ORF Transcript_24556/g.61835 Transcript_24556/m.61835 type:complete len:153 (+) Transcript_24556:495-953(+)